MAHPGLMPGRLPIQALRVGVVSKTYSALQRVEPAFQGAAGRALEGLVALFETPIAQRTTALGEMGVQGRDRFARIRGSMLIEPFGGAEAVRIGEWALDPKVSRHIADVSKTGELVRPYLTSSHTLQEIMAAGKPLADPRGFPGAVLYKVPGAFRGSEGMWELVVHPESKIVLHWLFKSTP